MPRTRSGKAAETLRRAAGLGRLTMDELDERLQDAYAARMRAELERLVADVVVPREDVPAAPPLALIR